MMGMHAHELRVCYFGPFDPNYPRNRTIIKGLVKNGVELIECNITPSVRLLDYLRLLRKYRGLDYDLVMLGARGDYFGQPLVPLC